MQKINSKHDLIFNAAAVELYKLQPPIAPDDLLEEYCDFGKYRWFIDLVQYDERLMLRMAVMLRDNLEKRGKINRRDLFSSMRKMAARMPDKLITDHELSDVLFEIFERVNISRRHNFSKTCIIGYQQAIDTVLKKVVLSDDAVKTLLSHASDSFRILNRIVNYPASNNIISMWALANFETDTFRYKRINLLALVLNDNPEYEMPMHIIEDDHNYFNRHDMAVYKGAGIDIQLDRIFSGKFLQERDDFQIISDFDPEKENWLPKGGTMHINDYFSNEHKKLHLAERLVRRYYYRYPSIRENPDEYLFDINKQFEGEKQRTYNVVRMYAILYSHLTMNIKTRLMKEFYMATKETALIYVARRMANVEFLEWMIRNY